MLRLFVAVPLPPEVQDRLEHIGFGIPGAAWVPGENMHITLRFLGEVSNAEAADIDDALMSVRAPAFDMTLEGVGHFGSLRQTRSLWAGVARNPALQHLRDKVESALVRFGRPPESRKFVPHVTLARFKTETGHHLANFLAEHNLLKIGPIRIEGFTLFQSHLKRDGSLYEALADYPLVDARAMAALT
ncbi:MAG: RNA 2',3'-cyclic phosphodiesterase [Rhodospirillaceae bacterium]|nr:RNA 2',3'-cyclic phosphodiesterase [Rhodospirillaceae bacterium]